MCFMVILVCREHFSTYLANNAAIVQQTKRSVLCLNHQDRKAYSQATQADKRNMARFDFATTQNTGHDTFPKASASARAQSMAIFDAACQIA